MGLFVGYVSFASSPHFLFLNMYLFSKKKLMFIFERERERERDREVQRHSMSGGAAENEGDRI